jgi:hypothetical protein
VDTAFSLLPVASFVIQRESGKGYRVTGVDGEYADEWKTQALALLDDLGQPDPKGPSDFFRWLGPVAPSGAYVGVSVKLMANGEARYHQGWFRLLKQADRPGRAALRILLVLLLGIVTGSVGDRAFLRPGGPGSDLTKGSLAPAGPLASSKSSARIPAPTSSQNSHADPGLSKLNALVGSSRDLRAKLKGYLSQAGLAAPAGDVTVVKRSVKLIADLDNPPPPIESIRLDNTDVAKLLDILRELDYWQERFGTAASSREK